MSCYLIVDNHLFIGVVPVKNIYKEFLNVTLKGI